MNPYDPVVGRRYTPCDYTEWVRIVLDVMDSGAQARVLYATPTLDPGGGEVKEKGWVVQVMSVKSWRVWCKKREASVDEASVSPRDVLEQFDRGPLWPRMDSPASAKRWLEEYDSPGKAYSYDSVPLGMGSRAAECMLLCLVHATPATVLPFRSPV